MEKHSHFKELVKIKYSSFRDTPTWVLIFQILESFKSQVAVYLLSTELELPRPPWKLQDLPAPVLKVKAYLRRK